MNGAHSKEYNMRISECRECCHYNEVDGKSCCKKENVYSYLTKCIQKKALKYYLRQDGLKERRVLHV